MEKHTGIYATSGAVQDAVDQGALFKPYLAIVLDENKIDWDTAEIPVEPMRGVIYNDTAATEFRITTLHDENNDLPALASVKIDGVEVINDLQSGTTDASGRTALYLDPTGYTEGEHTIEYKFANNLTVMPSFVFYKVSLVTITLPDSITEYRRQTFGEAPYLSAITIPATVTSLADNMFRYCTALTICNVIPKLTELPRSCFLGTSSLKSTGLTLDTSELEVLGSYAFAVGGIDTFTATGLTSVGEYAFQSAASLTSVVLDGPYTSIGRNCFHACTSLSSVTLNSAVTTFGISTFNNCQSLTSFVLPPNVTSIGNYCFNACTSLTSFTFNSVLESAGTYAFSLIPTGLNLRFPDSMKKISNYTFCGATMGDIYIPSGVTSLASGFTSYLVSAGTLEFAPGFNTATNSNRVSLYGGTSSVSSWVEKLIIPDSLNKQIYTSYFSAKELYVGSGVTNPGAINCLPVATKIVYSDNISGMTWTRKMYINKNIEEIHFPPNTTIASGFSGSTIQKVNFENVAAITCPYCFANCTGLTGEVNLYLTGSMVAWAFLNTGISKLTIRGNYDNYVSVSIPADSCQNLTSVTIYDALLEGGISWCPNLAWVKLYETPCLNGNFSNNPSLYQITISGRTVASSSFGSCTGSTSLTMVNVNMLTGGQLTVGSACFSGCTSLTGINSNVGVIISADYDAKRHFMGCSSLTGITLASGPTKIPDFCFEGCTSISALTFPESVTNIGGFGCGSMSAISSITINSLVPPGSTYSIRDILTKGNGDIVDVYVPASVYPTYMAVEEYWSETNPYYKWYPVVQAGKVHSL